MQRRAREGEGRGVAKSNALAKVSSRREGGPHGRVHCGVVLGHDLRHPH